MTSWILNSLDPDLLQGAHVEASFRLLKNAPVADGEREEERNLCFMSNAMELAVIDLLGEEVEVNTLRQVSSDAPNCYVSCLAPNLQLNQPRYVCASLAWGY